LIPWREENDLTQTGENEEQREKIEARLRQVTESSLESDDKLARAVGRLQGSRRKRDKDRQLAYLSRFVEAYVGPMSA
jgi:hypothetical protein